MPYFTMINLDISTCLRSEDAQNSRRDFRKREHFFLAASGSGSVIGRDPLPPRAVSTSHLPQRTLTQPPTAVSTLPLPRSNAGSGHRQPPLPLHRSTPQQQPSMRQLDSETTAQMLRAVSNGDIVKGPGM